MLVLAIDPGREKCGVAVVSEQSIPFMGVVGRNRLVLESAILVERHKIKHIVLGDGTGSEEIRREIQAFLPNCIVNIVDEHLTTEKARTEYWRHQRRRGWRRLVPTTMLVPPEPYDDYVAVILGRRYLKNGNRSESRNQGE